MKFKFILLLSICICIQVSAQTQTFYDFSWPTLTGDTISMSQYAGKKVMVVNVASYCAYTPEFAPLSQLDSLYSARYNFAIIGFPCNDYGQQRGSDSVVISTCNHYDVHFQIMSSVFIASGLRTPLYQWLQSAALNGVASHNVTWNFNKYLIDRQGNWVQWYDSPVSPLDPAIISWIVEDSASINTGINPVTADQDFLSIISGNPANDMISLQSTSATAQKLEINLYTTDGRLVEHLYNAEVSGNKRMDYSVAALPPGVYLLRASSQSINKTFKCVVQH